MDLDCLTIRCVMTIILVMATASLAAVKAKLSEYVASVHDTHERVVLTRNGTPAAVLISPDDLASLEETLAILSDPVTMAGIREAEADAARGDFATEAELRADLAARRAGQ